MLLLLFSLGETDENMNLWDVCEINIYILTNTTHKNINKAKWYV